MGEAKQERPASRSGTTYILAVVLSWLVPGSGHWILGHRVRSAIIGVVLLSVFWVGESVLAENRAVTREVHPIFFALQAGNGLSAFAANARWGKPRPVLTASGREIAAGPGQIDAIDVHLPRHLNLGILFTSVSGLLNLLVVIHVMDPRTWKEAPRP